MVVRPRNLDFMIMGISICLKRVILILILPSNRHIIHIQNQLLVTFPAHNNYVGLCNLRHCNCWLFTSMTTLSNRDSTVYQSPSSTQACERYDRHVFSFHLSDIWDSEVESGFFRVYRFLLSPLWCTRFVAVTGTRCVSCSLFCNIK